jgi:hypothetical protein
LEKRLLRFLAPLHETDIYNIGEVSKKTSFPLKRIYKTMHIILAVLLAALIAYSYALQPADFKFGEKAGVILSNLREAMDAAKLDNLMDNLGSAADSGKLAALGRRYANSIDEKAYYLGGADKIAAGEASIRGFYGVKPAIEKISSAPSALYEKMKYYYEGASARIKELVARFS